MKGNQKRTKQKESYELSRTEKKRRAKSIEQLAAELLDLPPTEISRLPASSEICQMVTEGRTLAGGARKRQMKFIAKILRHTDYDPLFDFLAEKKGSALKKKRAFHQLERLRDDLINDAILALEDNEEDHMPAGWPSPALAEIRRLFDDIDLRELRRLAERYARTRKPVHSREIFRQLHAASQRRQFRQNAGSSR